MIVLTTFFGAISFSSGVRVILSEVSIFSSFSFFSFSAASNTW